MPVFDREEPRRRFSVVAASARFDPSEKLVRWSKGIGLDRVGGRGSVVVRMETVGFGEAVVFGTGDAEIDALGPMGWFMGGPHEIFVESV